MHVDRDPSTPDTDDPLDCLDRDPFLRPQRPLSTPAGRLLSPRPDVPWLSLTS